ncbi:hypothetical protein JMUB6875_73230 [Nocardia sp. JMUB6875]|uniref:hypothetical protein n=1 Tax=Nocardia sp. JMUB6875 TaxID=3158170 RepID=UPI0032E5F713
MRQAHRSRPTLRRVSLILTPLAGAAAAVLAAGPATAESLSRETSSSDSRSTGTLSGRGLTGDGPGGNPRSNSNPGGIVNHGNDHTGIHANDPFGYYHTDMNPVLQNQHPRAVEPAPDPYNLPLNKRAGSPATWSPSYNADGSYTVCRPHASFC